MRWPMQTQRTHSNITQLNYNVCIPDADVENGRICNFRCGQRATRQLARHVQHQYLLEYQKSTNLKPLLCNKKSIIQFQINTQKLIIRKNMEQKVQNHSQHHSRKLAQTHTFDLHLFQEVNLGGSNLSCSKNSLQAQECMPKFNQIKRINQQSVCRAIGALKSVWVGRNGEPESMTYGTAFALSKRVIMTCTHNIYKESQSAFCQQSVFYPSIAEGSLQTQVGFGSEKRKFYHCHRPRFSMSYLPLKQEICLIVLEQDLPITDFIQIQDIEQISYSSQEVAIIGYPSPKIQLADVQVNRKVSLGQIYCVNNNIINHTIRTQCGQSGSPILRKDAAGNWKVIGIHTHEGLSSEYNSGVYFNAQTKQLIRELAREIQSEHSQDSQMANCIKVGKQEQTNISQTIEEGQHSLVKFSDDLEMTSEDEQSQQSSLGIQNYGERLQELQDQFKMSEQQIHTQVSLDRNSEETAGKHEDFQITCEQVTEQKPEDKHVEKHQQPTHMQAQPDCGDNEEDQIFYRKKEPQFWYQVHPQPQLLVNKPLKQQLNGQGQQKQSVDQTRTCQDDGQPWEDYPDDGDKL